MPRKSDFKGQWDLITELWNSTRGNKDSWKAQTKSCSNKDLGEKSSDPKRDWTRPACECLKVFYGCVGWQWPAPGRGVLAAAVLGGVSWYKSFLEFFFFCSEFCHTLEWNNHGFFTNSSTIEPADSRTGSTQAKQLTRRENSPRHLYTIGLKIYGEWLCPPVKDPDYLTASPSLQEACTNILSSSIRGQIEVRTIISHLHNKTHNHRNLTKMITWITALCNSMKLLAMLCRVTLDGQVMV